MDKSEAETHVKSRKKNFAVKVEELSPAPYAPAELALRVTTNKTQWQTLGLTRLEAAKVIAELAEFLADV